MFWSLKLIPGFSSLHQKVITRIRKVGASRPSISSCCTTYPHLTPLYFCLKGLCGILVICFVWCSISRGSWFHFFQTICTLTGWFNVSTTLGHILMPSAQPWADNRRCRQISQALKFRHQLTSVYFMCPEVGFDPTGKDGGYLWHKVFYTSYNFVYMTTWK